MRLSNQFTYLDFDSASYMNAEDDYGNNFCVGSFLKNEDGYYVFYPDTKPMTCKMLMEASKKCSILNTQE